MASQLSREQLNELRAVFKQFDRNCDGHVSVSEMGQVLREIGKNPSDKQLKEIMRNMDRDGSGQIEFNEFVEAMAHVLLETLTDDEIRDAFRGFDKDGSGKINAKELKQAAHQMGLKLTDAELNEMIHMADSDGDGQVSYEEFLRMMK